MSPLSAMPLRPFPFQFKVGIDVCQIHRVRKALGRPEENITRLISFLRRTLTRHERLEFWKRYGSSPHLAREIIYKHLAGRWAAKEATIKAVQNRRLTFHDIVIQSPANGERLASIVLDKQAVDRPLYREIQILEEAQSENKYKDDLPGRYSDPKVSGLSRAERSLIQTATMEKPDGDAIFQPTWAGAPDAENSNGDEEGLEELTGQIMRLSISHDGDYAYAVCLATEEPMPGDVGGEAAARSP